MSIETDVEDLTDAGVLAYLADLAGPCVRYITSCDARGMLRSIVRALDRASPDWPHTVLGLPLIEV